jgi:hypothetical protein
MTGHKVFVFGSNIMGKHAGGAALLAANHLGAPMGLGKGHISKNSYAIPTLGYGYIKLPLANIRVYVEEFVAYALRHPELTFYVTEVGCGIAGFDRKDIAPLFKSAIPVKNIYLPATFWAYLAPKELSRLFKNKTSEKLESSEALAKKAVQFNL